MSKRIRIIPFGTRILLFLLLVLFSSLSYPHVSAQIGSGNTYCLAWADYDRDGDQDLAVGMWGNNYLYINNGDGTFTEQEQFGSGNTQCMAWADHDNDGDQDLAVGKYYGMNNLYINNGDATFTEQEQFGGGDTRSMAWADFDNDGDQDLAVGMWGNNYLYINNGDGTFTEQEQFGSGETFAVAWADFDNDGDQDLAVGNYYVSNRLYINNGDGTFTGRDEFGSRYTRSLAWTDFDNDGDQDLAVGNAVENALYINNGDGTFTENLVFGVGDSWCVRWGEWNGDGYFDLAVGNDGESYLYINNGDGSFTSMIFGDDHIYSVAWGDADTDGDSDIAVAVNGGTNYIFKNQQVTFDLMNTLFSDNTFFVAGDQAYCTDVLGSAKIAFGLARGGVSQNPEGRTDLLLTSTEHTTGNLIPVGGPAINPVADEFDTVFGITYTYVPDVLFEIHCEGYTISLDLTHYPVEDICIVYLGQHGPRTILLVWGYGWQGTYAGSVYSADTARWTSHHLVLLRWLDTNADGLVQGGEITAEVIQ